MNTYPENVFYLFLKCNCYMVDFIYHVNIKVNKVINCLKFFMCKGQVKRFMKIHNILVNNGH